MLSSALEDVFNRFLTSMVEQQASDLGTWVVVVVNVKKGRVKITLDPILV